MLLARSENSSHRFYSLSAQIQKERKGYYQILEQTQKDGLDITSWIDWFLLCLEGAINESLQTFETIRSKEQVWKTIAKIHLNERQRKLINRILDGSIGKLTSSKWAKIAKCSQDTAYRDILDLIDKGVLVKNTEGGRSTSYSLNSDISRI
jgi:Fic family protein